MSQAVWGRYSPALPKACIEDGRISEAQLEAIVLAGQRHRHVHSGTRDGFLIGDGTGMGKGRTIAAIIYDNWLQGRKKVPAPWAAPQPVASAGRFAFSSG